MILLEKVHSQADQHDDGCDQPRRRKHPLHLVERAHQEEGAGEGHHVSQAIEDREDHLQRIQTRIRGYRVPMQNVDTG